MSLDIETTGLEWGVDILSVGVAYRDDAGEIQSEAWPLMACDLFNERMTIPQLRAKLIPLVRKADIIFGHNFAFDLSLLFKYGLLLPDDVKLKCFDTMLTARMIGQSDRVNLAEVAESFGIGDPEWRADKSKRKVLNKLPVADLLAYNAKDCKYQLLVGEAMYTKACTIYDPAFLMRESDFCRVVAKMRCNGTPLDIPKTEERIYTNTERSKHLHQTILVPSGIGNVNANKEIAKYLRKQGVPPQAYTDKGNEELDKKVLKTIQKMGNPQLSAVVSAILECKKLEKETHTWLKPFLEYAREDGCIHANFSVAGAVSYRLTCDYPGLQAVPWMDIWKPYLVCDYSQAEYRLAALYAQYHQLAEGYAQGLDAHTITACLLTGLNTVDELQRKIYGKSVNFAILYGAGKEKLAAATGFSIAETDALRSKVRKEMRPLFTLFSRVQKAWEDRGYIKLWTGKRIYAQSWDKRSYKALNQLCQGGVAELAKEAMMLLDAKGFPLWCQVHDSIYFPPTCDRGEITEIMMSALPDSISSWTRPAIQMKVDAKMKPHEMLLSELEQEQEDSDDHNSEVQPFMLEQERVIA